MALLAESGRAVSMSQAVAIVNGDLPAEHKHPVVVTFDDGTDDFVDNAVPILAKHDIPATLYLATGAVERGQPFWGEGRALTWEALRDATTVAQIDVGSHTHDHVLLDRISVAEATDQIDRSIELIGEHLGTKATHFAYPKALAPNAANLEIVRARFASAAIAGTRPNPRGTDPHLLWRTPIQSTDTDRWFDAKLNGGLGGEDRLRDLVNRVRYRGADR